MDFSTNKTYYIIEKHQQKANTVAALGRFIKYMNVVWGSDWLPRGKAQFEYGIISAGEYENIVAFEEDV